MHSKFKSGGVETLAPFCSGRCVKRTIYKLVWSEMRREMKIAELDRKGGFGTGVRVCVFFLSYYAGFDHLIKTFSAFIMK